MQLAVNQLMSVMRAFGLSTVAESSVQRTNSDAEDTQGKHKQDDARSRSVQGSLCKVCNTSQPSISAHQMSLAT